MLSGFLLRWVFNAIGIAVATAVVPGLRVPDAGGVLLAALVLGIVNASIRWVFLILTLPINILTLGLFTLVVNALMLYVVAAFTPLQIDSFPAAFLGALLIAVVSTALSHLVGR
ncbi:MAG: phage holin family protein [Armatimonadota bacterium]|nr:phage holin family protein [Armatimonadota bacterium]MDR7535817.1 phage holin family protein [Armatimonadota bacterium]